MNALDESGDVHFAMLEDIFSLGASKKGVSLRNTEQNKR